MSGGGVRDDPAGVRGSHAAGLVLWQRGALAWAGDRGRITGMAGLVVHPIGFPLAWRGLDAGTDAPVLIGTAEVKMFAGALVSRAAVPDAMGVLPAVLSGAVTSGLGLALWYVVLPQLGAGRAAAAQLAVPAIAALVGAVLLAELPGLGFWLAAVRVPGGVFLASLPYRVLPRRHVVCPVRASLRERPVSAKPCRVQKALPRGFTSRTAR